jgi:DNA-binding transcriptional ArsR family regulator
LRGPVSGLMVNHMVYSGLDPVFRALADPTRRTMLALLARGEHTIVELAAPFDMTLPAASKHVHVLEAAGLAEVRREGRVRVCRLRAEPLRMAARWLADYRDFWEAALDRLESYVSEEEESWKPQPRGRAGSRSGAPSRRRASGSSTPGRRSRD